MRMKQIRKWGMHVRKRRKLPNLNLGSPHLEVPRLYSLFLLWCQKQRRACCSAKEQQPVVQTTCCKNTIAMHSTFCMIMLILICKNPIKHLSVFFCWQRPHKCVVFLDVWKVSVVKRRKFFSWEEQMSVSVGFLYMDGSQRRHGSFLLRRTCDVSACCRYKLVSFCLSFTPLFVCFLLLLWNQLGLVGDLWLNKWMALTYKDITQFLPATFVHPSCSFKWRMMKVTLRPVLHSLTCWTSKRDGCQNWTTVGR